VSADIVTLPPPAAPSTTDVPASPWWTAADAAAYARVHPQQIFRACRERKLEHVRVGGRRKILVQRAWVDTWLQSLQVRVAVSR
jgi:excisionase family DNA binding protein